MEENQLFAAALGITPPWRIDTIDFEPAKSELTIKIDFERGANFPCPECQAPVPVHDTKQTTWRHLDFFQHKTFLKVRHPRIKCTDHNVLKVAAPWGRKGSGFSFLFEAMVLSLAQHIPMAALARHLREHDTKLWRILHHHVEEARSRADYSNVTNVGVDETSSRKRHNYITLFMDLDLRRVLYGTTGKGPKTFKGFKRDLRTHNGDPKNVKNICMDMSGAFIKGAAVDFPNAQVTFDKFHVVKMLNDAMDKVRRQERIRNIGLKRSKMLWLRNADRLNQEQKERLQHLSAMFPDSARAYEFKETFLALYDQEPKEAEQYLEVWLAWTAECGLAPFEEVSRTVDKHWDGIVNWFRSRLANGILEAINSLVQAAKAKARGYRNDRTLITMAYLIAGRLTYRLPT